MDEINGLSSRYRAHFINSCTGYKSANLLGTVTEDWKSNVAVFSSVTHLGSNPPLLGFVLRPTKVERNTYDNITKTKQFTVNHINQILYGRRTRLRPNMRAKSQNLIKQR